MGKQGERLAKLIKGNGFEHRFLTIKLSLFLGTKWITHGSEICAFLLDVGISGFTFE